MSEDFYLKAASDQWTALESQKMQELANLHAAKAAGDTDGAAAAIQGIANLESAKRSLSQLTAEYQASQNPPAPPPVSREERAARPLDKMTWDDALDLSRNSRHAGNLRHDDPNVQAGYREVERRRREGI